jgi:hypothetical protein
MIRDLAGLLIRQLQDKGLVLELPSIDPRIFIFSLFGPSTARLFLTHNFMSSTDFEPFSSGNWQNREFLRLSTLQNLHDKNSIT